MNKTAEEIIGKAKRIQNGDVSRAMKGMGIHYDLNSEQYNGYLLTHFKLGFKIETAKAVNYEFALGVKNAFDSHYASMILVNAPSFGSSAPRYYYPGEPRRFYVSLVFGF